MRENGGGPFMLSFLFPRVCGICKIKINQNNTCEKCRNILQYTLKKELCVRNLDLYVDQLLSLFVYRSLIRNRILHFKFDGEAYVADTFAELLSKAIEENGIVGDVLIPVPIHRKRYLERGYNQSELLSRKIAKQMNMKHDSRTLIKVENNVAQSTLHHEERQKNVVNVYAVRSRKNVVGKRILLVDDIYTTGATVNECARVLKQNGAKEVIAVTIAYASG